MKNQKMRTLVAIAGLSLGGLVVATTASAQSYGDGEGTPAAETEQTFEVDTPAPNADTGVADVVGIAQDQVIDNGTDDGQPAGGDRPEGRRGGPGGCNLDDAAAAIGIDEAELRGALDGGQTIAEVAEANGVDVDTVIDALVTAKAEHLDEQVAAGRLTDAEAAEKLADAEARITDRVNGIADTDET
jgi:hypothetical protein